MAHCFSLAARFVLGVLLLTATSTADTEAGRKFEIQNDRFVKNGEPIQIISGGIHYFRTLPYYWENRILKIKAMGMNAVETYVPWNYHELSPGSFEWDGQQDLEAFIRLAAKHDMLVILRPGPYICAEYNFGGLPAWLGSSVVSGGGTMKLRSSDPLYLAHVDRYWNELLPRMTPLLYSNGGPIVMVQVENEFGFIGIEDGRDDTYIRHLVKLAKNALRDDVLLFTTDPWNKAWAGSLPTNNEVYTAVDFGAGWPSSVDSAFKDQAAMNDDGKSPPFCSEYYPGWFMRMGENASNPDFDLFLRWMKMILEYKNNTGSVNLYMAHGGTNFGWSMGGQENLLKDAWGHDITIPTVEYNDGKLESYLHWQPVIQSYDYDAPISEAGDYGQPGIGPPPTGPPNKFLAIRDMIQKHTGVELPAVPPRPQFVAYGQVALTQQGTLLSQLGNLVTGPGIYSAVPKPMEEYGQWDGLILYRTSIAASELNGTAVLFVGSKVRDSAVILADGAYVGSLERDGKLAVVLNSAAGKVARANEGNNVTLDILVMQIGRSNFGRQYDLKGLVSGLVTINKKPLKSWRVFNLPLDSLDALKLPIVSAAAAPANTSAAAAAAVRAAAGPAARARAQPQPARPVSLAAVNPVRAHIAEELEEAARTGAFPAIAAVVASDGGESCPAAPAGNGSAAAAPSPAADGPTFYRGYFSVNGSLANTDGVLPDTYLDIGNFDWAKGLAFINGFNLGYYWPQIGPQYTMYVPGVLLKACNNEMTLLELGTTMKANPAAKVAFTDKPDLYYRPKPASASTLA